MTDTFNPLIGLNVWARSSRLALNKPLLVLLALGFLSQDKKDIAFASVEVKLNNLLREFGSNVKSPRAEYPFWRLQNDGIWTVTPGDLDVNSSGDVYATTLRKVNAIGRFNQNVLDWLFADKKRLTTATHEVLNVYFPDSLHDELLSAVGFIAFDEPGGVKQPQQQA